MTVVVKAQMRTNALTVLHMALAKLAGVLLVESVQTSVVSKRLRSTACNDRPENGNGHVVWMVTDSQTGGKELYILSCLLKTLLKPHISGHHS